MATTAQAAIGHPLEPLPADELRSAVEILRAERDFGERTRFATVALRRLRWPVTPVERGGFMLKPQGSSTAIPRWRSRVPAGTGIAGTAPKTEVENDAGAE